MNATCETAYAKINLALHVRARRSDGYHELDTLFAFLDSGDTLSANLVDTDQLSLEIVGPFAGELSNSSDNLVLRAAKALKSAYGIARGAAITLNKQLPVASGIGGGSADAAATCRLLRRLWDLDVSDAELASLLAPLGADIPACVTSQTVRGRGIGTDLLPVDASDLSDMPVLLVNPGKPLSTGPVFAAWDTIDRGALGQGSALDVALAGRNDLQDAAISICPEIASILTALTAKEPVLARMSGSGATCFALFSDITARDQARAEIMREHPSWWTMSGKLR